MCERPPIKTLDTESLKNFPSRQFHHALSQLIAGGIKRVLCDSTGRVQFTWALLDSAPCTFPFAGFALYLSAVINLS